MPFVKGMTKVKGSGRKLGVKNKRTLAFLETCDDNGFIIVEEFIKLFQETDNENLKLEILKEMSKYSYTVPKDAEKSTDAKPVGFYEMLKDVTSDDLKSLLITASKKESSNE